MLGALNKVLRSLVCGVSLVAGFSVLAQSDQLNETVAFDIPAQSLEGALLELSKQASFQIVFSSGALPDRKTAPISGRMPVKRALDLLLQGTELGYKLVGERTLTVILNGVGTPVGAPNSTGTYRNDGDTSQDIRVAQSGTSTQNSADSRVAEDNAKSSKSSDRDTVLRETSAGIPEMLVEGSRILNADIERTEDDPQPYVVFDREQIQRSMSTTLEEFLKTRLPMDTVQGTNSQSPGAGGFGNQSSVNLRGLGTNQTVILVDGRRMPTASSGLFLHQPDINGIPMSAVERIEVLPSTASGIYGGAATGGVVNIITRKDYTGLSVGATYGGSFDSGAANRRVDVGAGFNLEGGRTSVLVSAMHSDSNPLLVGDRDFAARARALQFANNPNAFFTPNAPPLGHTANVRNAAPNENQNLVLDNGTQLSSPRTFVPVGYAGPGSDGGVALASNGGDYNLDLPQDFNGARQSLLNHPTIDSASVNVRRSFGAIVDAFIDFSWLDNQGESYFSGDLGFVTLPADAPNNPFTTAVSVRFPSIGLTNVFEYESETLHGTAGLIVRLARDWTVAADYGWSRSRISSTSTSPAIGDPDGTGPEISAATAFANGTLDVLRDVNLSPFDYSPYLLPSPNVIFGPADTFLKDANLRLSGPVLQLPGGPLTLTGLVERREEEVSDSFQDVMNANAVRSAAFFPHRSQTVDSYYLEARMPWIADTQALPFLRALELQASVRRDEYETSAPSPAFAVLPSRAGPFPAVSYSTNEVAATEYTLALRYAPVEDVALRASFGTGFLPPAVNQITPGAPLNQTTTLTDPKRGNVSATVGPFTQVFGGNANLLPEDSESWSVGVIFTPWFLTGLRLSVDYTEIEKTDEIGILGLQQILNLEDSLPGRVVRAPLTPADAALGYTGGVITLIDSSFVNIAATRLEAYDLQADYALETERAGDFRFYAVVTWQPHFERQTFPASPFLDIVGFSFGLLEWRGNAGLTWERGPWTLGWNAQYYDSYLAYAPGATAAAIASATLNQGSDTIPSQTYHDLFARYRFADSSDFMGGMLDRTQIMIGVQNVFDESPPILATTGATGGYSTYGDPRLRRFSISVQKDF